MKPTTEQYLLNGTGPEGSVCLLFVRDCGIGDDIAALPAVAELAKSCEVAVFTIHPELWQGIAVTVVGVAMDFVTCDNGDLLDMLWDSEHLPSYERIFKLSAWGVWQDNEVGGSDIPRTEQLASILGVTVGGPFDYVAVLNAKRTLVERSYAVLSVESREPMRTLSDEQALDLYVEMLDRGGVVWLSQNGRNRRKTSCGSLAELVSLVYNATRFVGIDNGVAHIAVALGVPVTLIGGMTDIRYIFEQYGNPLRIIQSGNPSGECKSPCYRLPENGFTGQLCCGLYATPRCMAAVSVEEVIAVAYAASTAPQNAILTQ